MSFNVIVTSVFKKHISLKADIQELIDSLEKEPTQGESLGKDCYKVRMAITSKGRGKSGGSRVITCVKVVEHDVYLLSIYDKSDKKNTSLFRYLSEQRGGLLLFKIIYC